MNSTESVKPSIPCDAAEDSFSVYSENLLMRGKS